MRRDPLESSPPRLLVRRRHYPALDGLRCLAIAGVVWHHSLPCALPGWLGRGHAGVPLFFALSGFLITTLLLAERHATGDVALGPFWMRRCLRIFPLYYATLAGFVLWLGLQEPTAATGHFWGSLPYYASYTSNWFVEYDVPHPVWFGFAWSLATEEQFYLLWPTLLRHAERLARPLAPLGLMALLGVDQLAESGAFAPWMEPGSAPSRIATSLSGAMLLGALLAWAVCQPRGFDVLRRALATRHALAACALVSAILIWQPLGPPLLLELAFALWVGAAASYRGRGLVGQVLAAKPLGYVGRVSYGIYLLHVPVLGVLKRSCPWLSDRPLALFPLVFSLSLALSALSYRWFEGPLLALKERFRPLATPAPELAAAHAARGRASSDSTRWVHEG